MKPSGSGDGVQRALFTSPQRPQAGVDATELLTAARPETEYFLPFHRIAIPVHSMGPDGLLLAVNDVWVAYTGYGRDQAIGRSFADFLDPASAVLYRQKAVPELISLAPDGESRSVEYRLIKASGEVADIVLTARPERERTTGRFLHSLTVINDITARNRAEAALRHAQKIEALGALTSGVAHDFNNLLMVILGSLQMLAGRLPDGDPRAARLVDAALQGAKRGTVLTAKLLAFARQQELTPLPIALGNLVASLRPMLIQLLGPTIAIEEDLPANLWNLQADPSQFELALLNIAANARDAMPEGGTLRMAARNVTVDPTESAFIDLRTQPESLTGDYVVLTVSDTGHGMDEGALARAAEPFFTTKAPGKGTGLGLSMVHGFSVQSGGALLLSSRLNVGTTVELWLRRTTETVRETEAAQPSLTHADAPGARKLRILLVDDDPLILMGTTSMLEELGHDAIHAVGSGAQALAALRRGADFDLLLTDYMMPGMSGVQLAVAARALHPSLPVLVASGFSELEGSTGAEWPRLRKPYTIRDLSAALAAVKLSQSR